MEKSYVIKVKVQPKSKHQKIERINLSEFKVMVLAAPEKGRANKEVIGLLAEYLNLPPSFLKIIKGETSRHKWIKIELKDEKKNS